MLNHNNEHVWDFVCANVGCTKWFNSNETTLQEALLLAACYAASNVTQNKQRQILWNGTHEWNQCENLKFIQWFVCGYLSLTHAHVQSLTHTHIQTLSHRNHRSMKRDKRKKTPRRKSELRSKRHIQFHRVCMLNTSSQTYHSLHNNSGPVHRIFVS